MTVFFEWDGRPGKHHFEGLWKDPSSKVVVVSAFEYEPTTPRFGAYWQLNLNDKMQTGWWSLEARVDGEYAGSHSFEIVAKPRPEMPPSRTVLSLDELYQRARSASVFIEKLNASGQRFNSGLGFRMGSEGLILTTFHNIDGATSLRVTSAGRAYAVDSLVAWDRRLDFAVLKIPDSGGATLLPPASADSGKIGDRVFGLDSPAEGNLVIGEGNIVGRHSFPSLGERLNVSLSVSYAASGGAVLNEYGEVLGVAQAGGLILPGSWSVISRLGFPLMGSPYNAGTVALPLSALPNPLPTTATSFSELAQRGVVMPPVVENENLMTAGIGRQVVTQFDIPRLEGEQFGFSRREGTADVLLAWNPRKKTQQMISMKIYNFDNRLLSSTKLEKLKLSPKNMKFNVWKITFGQMPTGIYRIDVTLDDVPVWRTFFRLVD